jgi:hypothetical protein
MADLSPYTNSLQANRPNSRLACSFFITGYENAAT